MFEWIELSVDDVRSDDNYVLRWSCRNGHLEIVKYLIEMFELNVDDVRSEDNFALKWSCKKGHYDVCMYLIKKGEYEWSDISKICDEYFLRWYDGVLRVYECLNGLSCVVWCEQEGVGKYFNDMVCLGVFGCRPLKMCVK